MHMHEQPHPQDRPQLVRLFQSRKTTLILLGFLAVGAFFLLTEHTAHLLGILPYLIFLLCPLMMLFMHGGQGGHDGHEMPKDEPPRGGQQ
jgi:hypothetical protein